VVSLRHVLQPNFICLLLLASLISYLWHPHWSYYPDNVWREISMKTYLIMRCSPASCYFLSFRYKYLPFSLCENYVSYVHTYKYENIHTFIFCSDINRFIGNFFSSWLANLVNVKIYKFFFFFPSLRTSKFVLHLSFSIFPPLFLFS
jgi:hypothetical protein